MLFPSTCSVPGVLQTTRLAAGGTAKGLLSVLLVALLSWCFPTFSSAREEKVLRVAVTIPLDQENFDPNKSFYTTHDFILNPLFDKLLIPDRQGKLIPHAATSIDFSQDGSSITIRLRDDGVWSNGQPVVAEDFVRGLKRAAMADSETHSLLAGIEGVKEWALGDYSQSVGIRAIDDGTILIELDSNFRYDISQFYNMHAHPYPPESGAEWVGPDGEFVSNGPYRIRHFSKNEVVLERNPYYRLEKPYFDVIVFRAFFQDEAIDDFITKKADLLLGPMGKRKDWLISRFKPKLLENGYPRVYIVSMAKYSDALKNRDVREALYIALDREEFADNFTLSSTQGAFAPLGSDTASERENIWHVEGTMSQRYERARQLLQKAGYSREKPLKLKLVVASSVHGYQRIANFLQDSWHAVGIEIEQVEVPLINEAIAEMGTGEYDLMIMSFYQLTAHMYLMNFIPTGTIEWNLNSVIYGQEQLKDKYFQISRSQGSEYRKAFIEAEKLLFDGLGTLPVVSDSRYAYMHEEFQENQKGIPKLVIRYITMKP